jgi:CheY-like chemotaxis protein
MSDLLLAGSIESKERGYLETLRNSASHLLILLNDLLDLTRMESGRLIVVERPMRPEAIVREVLALAPNDNPRVTLRHRSAGQTPEWVVGDGARLRQIIFNLVGNAQKFTDVGWIEVTTQYENGWLDIQVEDTGAGIPEDMQESIFQRFVQVDESSTRKFGGLGLGLPIARELARRMKGELTVESQFGVGSRFRLRIPAPECAGAEVTTGYEPKPLADKRILLVEDNAVNRVVAQRMLERLGITVKLARNGREAVLACASETFELVLMDLQMPEMDGFAATREIRASGNEVPVVAVTASAMIGERERCLSAGMNDYLSKPIDRRALEEMLEKWLAADQGSTSSR